MPVLIHTHTDILYSTYTYMLYAYMHCCTYMHPEAEELIASHKKMKIIHMAMIE